MKVEVRGAGFVNKGAELMLRSVIARLRSWDAGIRVVVEPGAGASNARLTELNLDCLYPSNALYAGTIRSFANRWRIAQTTFDAFTRATTPRGAWETFGLVDRRDCDAVLDISGYAYGDKFAAKRARNAALAFASYERRDKPAILLPQMFGPFRNRGVAHWTRRACLSATAVYARDRQSFQDLEGLLGVQPHLHRVADLTIAETPSPPVLDGGPGAEEACVVPNRKMAEAGKAEWGEKYLDRLEAVLQRLLAAGMRTSILLHAQDPGDRRMADELQRRVGADRAPIFDDPDPKALKRKLASMRLVVGSRFHALVASLSTGTPAVALGWAHKYETLLEDFGVPELLHRAENTEAQLLETVDALIDPQGNAAVRQTIDRRGEELRNGVEAMWSDVREMLLGKAAAAPTCRSEAA